MRESSFGWSAFARARPLVDAGYAGVLLVVTGALAWVTGEAFVFPSLGPTAYLLATVHTELQTGRRVIGGHLIGVVAGLLAYHTIAGGLSIVAAHPSYSGAQFRLIASGVVSVVLTTAGMRSTGTEHAPACATTLIVSLGLLSAPEEGGFIVVSVCLLYLAHLGGKRGVDALLE
ncbi:HPP family protein [Halorientalis regularis]|uniref:HPP family protein n=1 Tax=Halorientalis regularis TaxID=660518 RepID=A0A1G7FCW4_9EURY|nr:HPP family protein [Halorientalis regularis]SDE73686.1 HPP family protein [Halorientalis regularis]